MTTKAPLLALALLAGCSTERVPMVSVSELGLSPTGYINCEEEAADWTLEVVYSIDNVLSEKKERFFLRAKNAEAGLATPVSRFSSADGVSSSGVGVGYGASSLGRPESQGYLLALSVYWATASEQGRAEEKILFPYFLDVKSSKGRFTYTASWTQKKRPNQAPEPMPLKRHGSS